MLVLNLVYSNYFDSLSGVTTPTAPLRAMPSAIIDSACSPLKATKPKEVSTHIDALQVDGSRSLAKKNSFMLLTQIFKFIQSRQIQIINRVSQVF